MKTNNISLDEFTGQMERLFGKKLTLPAARAATDFWNHWESFTDLISRRQLSVHVDPFFLAHSFPQYRTYHTWKGGGIVLLVLGLAVVWFVWPIGVALLVGGIVLRLYGNRVRFNDAKAFAEEVMKEATLSPADAGYARLCANYIAGIIELATPAASAHWPQHPSNIITGTQTFIETGEAQQSAAPLPCDPQRGHSEGER
jgi:hypothetical protein